MVMIRPQHSLCGAGRALQGNRKKRRCDLSLYIRVDSLRGFYSLKPFQIWIFAQLFAGFQECYTICLYRETGRCDTTHRENSAKWESQAPLQFQQSPTEPDPGALLWDPTPLTLFKGIIPSCSHWLTCIIFASDGDTDPGRCKMKTIVNMGRPSQLELLMSNIKYQEIIWVAKEFPADHQVVQEQ